MSKYWRDKKGIRYTTGTPDMVPSATDTGVAEGYVNYDPSASDNNVMLPIGTDDLLVQASAMFPGYRETFHPMASPNAAPAPAFDVPQGVIRDQIDWEIGGSSGEVNDLPYSLGVVSSEQVENFELTGEQALIRRQRNPAEVGAVSTADSNSLLSIAYAQSAANFFPGEASQGDMVRAV